MLKLRCLALSVLIVAVPAWATEQAPAKPKRPKQVCRTEAHTGSRLASSTCHSVEEWEAIDAAQASAAKTMMDDVAHRIGQQGGSRAAATGPFGR